MTKYLLDLKLLDLKLLDLINANPVPVKDFPKCNCASRRLPDLIGNSPELRLKFLKLWKEAQPNVWIPELDK